MTEATLRKAHFTLWKAWRAVSGNLSEARAWEALMASGFDYDSIVDALSQLIDRGDITTRYYRDMPSYGLIRDELGFTATK